MEEPLLNHSTRQARRADTARRVALLSIGVSGALAFSKLLIGWMAGSTAVVADGFESAGDVVGSTIVLLGLMAASRPPDAEHPYGHGRFEMLSGLAVGVLLAAAGAGICVHAIESLSVRRALPAAYGIWPLVASIVFKAILSSLKFRYGRRTGSGALIADAWNDLVDILSGGAAMVALGLTLLDPSRFLHADQYGGFVVGLIVIFTGARIVRETSLQLVDTMPDENLMNQIRCVALAVPGVDGVEKCFARKTGFEYHVDLHLEVDPEITVRESHDIATQVRIRLKENLDFIADVLVHVEPSPAAPGHPATTHRETPNG
jgi:cation diffusion facilitator family transporter